MRYMACVGRIVAIKTDTVDIETTPDSELIEAFIKGDGIFDLEVGMQGVFVGTLSGGAFMLEKVEIKKFLDPLYQRNLLTVSSDINLVPVVGDPFPRVFKLYTEFEKQIKEKEENDEESNTEGGNV